jgi:hypothetical protein
MNNLNFDFIAIVFCGVLLCLTVLTIVMDPFLRFRPHIRRDGTADHQDSEAASDDTAQTSAPAQLPSVSIVLAPHDQVESLNRTLPSLLHQDYPADYQVVVVGEDSEREGLDVVKRIQYELQQAPSQASLYLTAIQDSSRFMSRKKLAITLGVKAAKYDWVILMEANCMPDTDQWLKKMAEKIGHDKGQLTLGYCHYDAATSSFKRFERIQTAHYLMREDTTSTAYRTNGTCVMFNKETFLHGEGYQGNLNLIRGEYDFLVNKFAERYNTQLVLDPEAWLVEEAPDKKEWLSKHIYYFETRKVLKRSLPHRLLFDADQICLHVSLLAIIGSSVYALLSQRYVIAAAAVLALILIWVFKTLWGHQAMKRFGERMPFMLIYPYEIATLWHNLSYRMRHALADKLDFTTHKQ